MSTARRRAAARKAKPGRTGKGAYYYVEVRPKTQFATLSGSWDTLKWLIGKAHAHVERGRLVPDSPDARKVLDALGSSPRQIGGDRFQAQPRSNIPGAAKRTAPQKRARRRNAKKAQAARRPA